MVYTGRPATPPERGPFFSLQVYERVGISLGVCVKRPKRAYECILWL